MNFPGQGSDKPNEILILELPLLSKQMKAANSTSSGDDEGSGKCHEIELTG